MTSKKQLDEVVAYYLTQDAFAFDVETVGDRRGDTPINEVLWITLATHGRADVIPMGHPNGELLEVIYPLTGQGEKRVEKGLPARPSDYSRDAKKATYVYSEPPAQLFPADVFKALEPLFFNDKILTVGHNLLFDLTSVAKYYGGRVPSGPYFDTMIGSFVLDNRNKNKVGLDDCLQREFGYHMVKGVGAAVEKHTFKDVAKYAYLDAKYTFLLWKNLAPRITESKVDKIMKLEMDVLAVLCAMKLTGAPIDTEALEHLYEKLLEDIEKAKAEIFKTAGRQFNINSNQEKQYLLYSSKKDGGRGLPPKMLTLRGEQRDAAGKELDYSDYSVSAEALEAYRDRDPLVTALLTYSDLNKLLTTYVVPYMGGDVTRTSGGKTKIEHKESLLINKRIHCDFVQHGAETGRFSSRKRIIASMSEDPIMLDNYLNKRDIYTTVGEVMGVDRKAGKVLVLSMAYGVGPDKISRQIGCSVNDAKKLLDDFSKTFPSVSKYRLKVLAVTRASNPPFVYTLLGRRRYLPEINSNDRGLRAAAERQAFNTRIQGSAADIIKVAMVRAHAMIPQEARLLLTVHDELVTLTPDHLVTETEDAIREAMEGINLLNVPLIADITTVQRWGEAK